MPQPIPMNVGNGTDATNEIVPLSEPSLVLLFVLASIYPHVEIPSIASFADAHVVADAADKYDMFRVREVLRIAVLANESLRKVPLRLYHLARKCKWGDVIASSSEMTLDWNLMTGPLPNDATALNEHEADRRTHWQRRALRADASALGAKASSVKRAQFGLFDGFPRAL
ncbi:hypothetical protein SCHPADRAFT_906424 [Schizopora paradoxa]|uniref:BTB domain-containing protein n=1 Tax=Schizopora paradoxa TaxID=27342 RepID=A0A0H2RNE8_9AGAM|nr:hypothetical protein SCHPADRAFT_906424 [Schizopora paradoxa]